MSAVEASELRPGLGYLKGYLPSAELPDSLALPPPAEALAAQAADGAAFRALTALQGTPRGALTEQDANLKCPVAAEALSCALGVPITEQAAPHLNMLLRLILSDARGAAYKVKTKYQRTRPFWSSRRRTARRPRKPSWPRMVPPSGQANHSPMQTRLL